MKILAKGAEAIIYRQGNKVIKDRIKKSYRNRKLDLMLRKYRTRRESKIIDKARIIGINVPKIIKVDEVKKRLVMEFIAGVKVRDILEEKPELGYEIGKAIGLMHSNDIIHGDLTTSNMLLYKGKIYFIDFGLSFISTKIEDKAVDLHLLDQALNARHYKIYDKVIKLVIEGYKKTNKNYKDIFKRWAKVKLRGRYKQKS